MTTPSALPLVRLILTTAMCPILHYVRTALLVPGRELAAKLLHSRLISSPTAAAEEGGAPEAAAFAGGDELYVFPEDDARQLLELKATDRALRGARRTNDAEDVVEDVPRSNEALSLPHPMASHKQ